jgi:hypothetical protein
MAGKGVSTDGIYLLTDMRQPALSGPENENARERVEYVPAKHPGAISMEFRIPFAHPWPFPPWTFGPPPLPGLFADPAQTDLVSRTSPSPFPSRRPSKMDMSRAHSALCAAAKRKCVLRSDLVPYTPIVLLLLYCKGVGVGCACALLSHRLSLVEATALRGSPDERMPLFHSPSPRPNLLRA